VLGVLLGASCATTGQDQDWVSATPQHCQDSFFKGDIAVAERVCAGAVRGHRDSILAWHMYALVLVAQRRYADTLAACERAKDILGRDYAPLVALQGAALFLDRQYARSRPYLERAVALEPDEWTANELLCNYWARARDFSFMDRSRVACEVTLKEMPDEPNTLFSLAWIAINQHRTADAKAICEGVLARHPSDVAEKKARICLERIDAGG
jgi:tetratricopeptide (TPR) repeat protein